MILRAWVTGTAVAVLLLVSGACGDGVIAVGASGDASDARADIFDARVPGVDGWWVAPDAAPPSTLTVAVVSDLNASYGSTTYGSSVHASVDRIIERRPDLVLSTGDMVAGQQGGLDYAAMWDGFHAAVSDPFAQAGIPFAVTPGNHDASGYAGFAGERAQYESEWLPRKPAVTMIDDSAYPFRYAFTLGSVLFISLDDTLIAPLDGSQRSWLEEQLIAGAAYPVKILFGHIPLYPISVGRESEILDDPDLEALLRAHEVTLFISGHHHAYYPGKRQDLGLLSMACLGSGPRALVGQSATSPRSYVWLEIDPTGDVTSQAYSGASLDQPVARTSLPASVGSGTRIIIRDDL